jgi:hypothetical protein
MTAAALTARALSKAICHEFSRPAETLTGHSGSGLAHARDSRIAQSRLQFSSLCPTARYKLPLSTFSWCVGAMGANSMNEVCHDRDIKNKEDDLDRRCMLV